MENQNFISSTEEQDGIVYHITTYADASCLSFRAHFGNGVLVANLIDSKISFHTPKFKNGKDSVTSVVLIKKFKNFVNDYVSKLESKWLEQHKALYASA